MQDKNNLSIDDNFGETSAALVERNGTLHVNLILLFPEDCEAAMGLNLDDDEGGDVKKEEHDEGTAGDVKEEPSSPSATAQPVAPSPIPEVKVKNKSELDFAPAVPAGMLAPVGLSSASDVPAPEGEVKAEDDLFGIDMGDL